MLTLSELFGRSFIVERFPSVLLSCCAMATNHESILRLCYLINNSHCLSFVYYHRKSLVKLTFKLG
ncbi:MAG: hypothetical protein ACTS5A_02565 [Candidatus Hodgkinia cicadicola]